jgi:hypothetical protein
MALAWTLLTLSALTILLKYATIHTMSLPSPVAMAFTNHRKPAIHAFQKIEGMLQLHHEALAVPSSALSRPPFEAIADSTHATASASSPRSYELHGDGGGGGASISFPQVCLLFPCPLPL